MTRRKKWLIAGCSAVAVTLALATMIWGLGGDVFSRSGEPDCEKLPKRAVVESALADESEVVEAIKGISDGVRVEVATPCPDPEAALVRVTVDDEKQRKQVEKLAPSDTLQVPVVVGVSE